LEAAKLNAFAFVVVSLGSFDRATFRSVIRTKQIRDVRHRNKGWHPSRYTNAWIVV